MKAHKGQFFAVFLFSAYINGLTEVLLNECFFADDTKIVGSENHQQILQNDIDSAITWSEKKTIRISISRSSILWNFLYKIELTKNCLFKQENIRLNIRDLGVNFSKNFSGNFHNDVIVKKGLKKLAHILRVMPA